MATLKGTYDEDQSVIEKMDDGMQKLMKAAKEASSKSADHTQMHTAWGAVHDVLEALYMKPNPKSEGSQSESTEEIVGTLPKNAEATTTEKTKPETKGGGHCKKKSKRRRRKGRKGRRATKKK